MGESTLEPPRALMSGVQGAASGFRIVVANRGARLDGIADEPGVDQFQARDMRGLGERLRNGLRITQVLGGGNVVRHRLPKLGSVRVGGFLQGGQHGQFLVLDFDALRRLDGLRRGFSNDGSHRLSRVAGGIGGDWIVRRGGRGLTIGTEEGHRGWNRLHAIAQQVLSGENPQHAGHGLGLGRVNAHDAGVAVETAQEVQVRLPLKVHVVHKATLAPDQSLVLVAAHRLSRFQSCSLWCRWHGNP